MSSKDYWEKREAEALKHRITEEKEFDKRLNQIYANMLEACQNEINAFFGRYADKEGITIAEAKKRVSQLDIKRYERKAKRYVKEKNFSAEANEEMRLYNLAMKVNRLEMLKANIGLELIAGHDEMQKFMEEILQGRTEDELKRQAGILGESVKNNAKTADTIVNASFHNAKFSDRIWLYQNLMKSEVDKLLQSGMIQGKNPRVLARELEKKFGVSKYNAERLMRTELARVQTEAQKESFIRNGFSMYTFHTNTGCCDICAALNGKHFKVKDMMPGKNASPMHPMCRCSVSAYEDSDEYEAWLDYLSNGGTTAEWEKLKKSEKTVSSTSEVAKNKYGDEIQFYLDGMSEEGQEHVKKVIKELSEQYETSLKEIYFDPKLAKNLGEKGNVDNYYGYTMNLGSSKASTHEFFHTLTSSKRKNLSKKFGDDLEINEEFQKEADKLFREYKKVAMRDTSQRISEYSLTNVDEFMAEAFASMHGGSHGAFGVGADSQFASKASEVIDKYFKKNKNAVEKSAKSSTMKLSNEEVRKMYIDEVSKIKESIDSSLPIEEQAKQAFEARNRIRTQARQMMADEETRKKLDKERPNKTFEELVESKMQRKGMTREEAIKDVYETATKTNEAVNRELGLGGE